MTARCFLDTNVLLYAFDSGEAHHKRATALAILRRLTTLRRGVVSTQVLGEFFVVGTRKMNMPVAFARAVLAAFSNALETLSVTPEVIHEAARGVAVHGLNYWDAQLWAAARLHRVPLILTEDLQDGAVLGETRIVNPFRPGWRIENLAE